MAQKKQFTVPVRMPEELLRKLMLLCEKEGRSLNNEINMLARNAVAYHERARGGLDPRAAAAVDLSEYENTEE
ncbi:MAG: Arc family DNA-binding protein [Clostridia bacterium]|nr:Arc family DNA-binding protein [Clostridia bacterium]